MQFFHYQKYKSVSPKYFYFLFFESTKENFEGRIIILLVAVRGFRASRDRDQAFEALENSEAARLDIGSLAGPFSIPLHGFIQSTTRVADERVSERARAHSYPLLVFAVTPVRLDVLPAWANRLFFFFLIQRLLYDSLSITVLGWLHGRSRIPQAWILRKKYKYPNIQLYFV